MDFAGAANLTPHGSDVYYSSAFFVYHVRENGTAHVKSSGKMSVYHVVPVLVGYVGEKLLLGNSGVVYKNLYFFKGCGGGFYHVVYILKGLDVAFHNKHLYAVIFPDNLGEIFTFLTVGVVGENKVVFHFCQSHGNGSAYSAGSSGYNGCAHNINPFAYIF